MEIPTSKRAALTLLGILSNVVGCKDPSYSFDSRIFGLMLTAYYLEAVYLYFTMCTLIVDWDSYEVR